MGHEDDTEVHHHQGENDHHRLVAGQEEEVREPEDQRPYHGKSEEVQTGGVGEIRSTSVQVAHAPTTPTMVSEP
jgi:hypothetical protein